MNEAKRYVHNNAGQITLSTTSEEDYHELINNKSLIFKEIIHELDILFESK